MKDHDLIEHRLAQPFHQSGPVPHLADLPEVFNTGTQAYLPRLGFSHLCPQMDPHRCSVPYIVPDLCRACHWVCTAQRSPVVGAWHLITVGGTFLRVTR